MPPDTAAMELLWGKIILVSCAIFCCWPFVLLPISLIPLRKGLKMINKGLGDDGQGEFYYYEADEQGD